MNMKKILFSLATAFAGVMAFAEGENAISTAVATEQLTRLTDAIKNWFTDAWPIVIGICGVLLLPWLIKMAIRVVKSLASAFK